MSQFKIQNNFECSAGLDAIAIDAELRSWQQEDKVRRLWAGDASLWTDHDEAHWTGWLNVIAAEFNEVPRIEALASEFKAGGVKHIVLLGMGGSSLCPALMANTFGKINNYPHLRILDSTDPLQIHHLENKIDLTKTIFIVSSKSGSTLEPNIFKQYFYKRLQSVLGKKAVGERFIAITDPDTTLATLAKEAHFKAVFYGIPAIGGRYSALSNFGMTPLGLMGGDVKAFLQHAETMQRACRETLVPKNNPGILLGVILGVCANRGKNKVTLVASPGIRTLGDWVEQLLAESTGKVGKGLIPINQEALGSPEVYSNDRVFVYTRLESAPDPEQDLAIAKIEKSGHPVVRLSLSEKTHLGAELFRWEIATVVASNIIGINPFDQPDVEASKVRTLQLTEEYDRSGKISQPNPLFSSNEFQLFTDETNAREISQAMIAEPSIEEFLRAHFSRIKPDDYVDISAFIEMSDENTALLQECRILIRDAKKVATCLGFGPRFLHSTGQAYKGGPNTGVFLQITTDHAVDIPVLEHRYTFGVVIDAQAQGDFEVLGQRSRRVLRLHIATDVRAGLQQLNELIRRAFQI